MKKIGHVKINIYVMSLLALLIALGIYFLMFRLFGATVPQWVKGLRALLVLLYVTGIVFIHELIHMIVAYFYVPVKDVRLRIKILTWEVSVDKPLQRNRYLLYTFAPGLILSLAGILVFIAVSSVDLRYFSALLFLIGFAGATGDVCLALGALKYPKNCYVLDRGAELDILTTEE